MKNVSIEKLFIYIFALFVTASTFAFDLMLCFHEIPEKNKSIVDFIAGVLNTSCLVSIVAYFYSSTATSREKNKMLLDTKKENESA